MKKILWALGIVVLGILGYIAVTNFMSYGKRAKAAEARLLAKAIHQILDLHKARKGTYPPVESIQLKDSELHYYKWGVGSQVKEFCSDCLITPDSYKIVIYGNIDSDTAMDVWLLESPDGSLFQISDDVAK